MTTKEKNPIPLRLQDPMENAAKSEKSEPVVKKKKINQESKSDQKAMSVHESKMFQCSICNKEFNSKITSLAQY
jgi:hypothetical protein